MSAHGYGAAHAYLKAQVESSTPLERVAMLYTAAAAALTTALDAMAKRDLRTRRTAMNRALAIVAELQNTLDLERGGQVAAELDRLYTYMMTRMIEGVSKQDPAPIEQARSVLVTLGDAWQQIVHTPASAPAATAPPGPTR